MSNDTYDWPTIKNLADRDLAMFGKGSLVYDSRLRGGKNLVTQEVLGLISINGKTIEVSTGWFLDHRMYGVTFDQPYDAGADPRDKSFHEWTDVIAYLKEIAGFPAGS